MRRLREDKNKPFLNSFIKDPRQPDVFCTYHKIIILLGKCKILENKFFKFLNNQKYV